MPDCMSDAASGVQTAWQQAKLLNRYYEKVGRAAAGQGCCPRFVEFAAGFGCVDESDPRHPVLINIPPNMEEVPNEFYRAEVQVEYSNGVTLCKCEIPQAAVAEPVRHNLIGIFDQDGELVAVCTTLPDWVTPSEIYRAFPAITFPLEEEVVQGGEEEGTPPEGDSSASGPDNGDSETASPDAGTDEPTGGAA